MYVDDVIASVEDRKQAIRVAASISRIFKEMEMIATKFASNSSEVLATIPVDDLALT